MSNTPSLGRLSHGPRRLEQDDDDFLSRLSYCVDDRLSLVRIVYVAGLIGSGLVIMNALQIRQNFTIVKAFIANESCIKAKLWALKPTPPAFDLLSEFKRRLNFQPVKVVENVAFGKIYKGLFLKTDLSKHLLRKGLAQIDASMVDASDTWQAKQLRIMEKYEESARRRGLGLWAGSRMELKCHSSLPNIMLHLCQTMPYAWTHKGLWSAISNNAIWRR
ncbi:hypothetical protein SeLEV6574_g06573 [Synchytrium endobioticum]|uniref:Uncharacterized protein n=1 Tax=Synchytrium endobioticum TaxID=286115 RepID=A0A507CN23_9FUNG|nr:hypothetical protein SeLEV6574_g06573 [Synchytrium endobioticum]